MNQDFNTRQTLIAKMRKSHNENSWDEFVYFYRDYILMVAKGMGLDHHDAEDLVQAVLLILWKKLPDFEYEPNKCKFRSWMNNVIRKSVLDFFRKRGRYQRRLEKAGKLESDQEALPEIYEIAENQWKSHIFKLSWERLKPGFSDKIVGCFEAFLAGTPIAEICELMDIKENTAYVYRKKVLDHLQREICNLDEQLS